MINLLSHNPVSWPTTSRPKRRCRRLVFSNPDTTKEVVPSSRLTVPLTLQTIKIVSVVTRHELRKLKRACRLRSPGSTRSPCRNRIPPAQRTCRSPRVEEQIEEDTQDPLKLRCTSLRYQCHCQSGNDTESTAKRQCARGLFLLLAQARQ